MPLVSEAKNKIDNLKKLGIHQYETGSSYFRAFLSPLWSRVLNSKQFAEGFFKLSKNNEVDVGMTM